MRLGCVGDVHCALDRLDAALEWLASRGVDGLLLTGDFTPGLPRHGDPAGPARRALARARRLGVPVLFVPGNHDPPVLPLAGNVDRDVAEVAGLRVAGLGGSGPNQMGFPYEWTDEELADVQVPPRHVLLTHAPPAATRLDRLAGGEHVGSRVIRRLAREHRGVLVCGHIHESAGVERVGEAVCHNVGSLGAPYAATQAGLLEMDPDTRRAVASHWQLQPRGGWRCVARGAR